MPEFATRLVSIMPDAEKIILYCARVSSNQENTNTGLISYLIDHRHWSPFEMASACVEVDTSRAISHQMIRHKSFGFQEFSQRYASAGDPVFYEAREQAEKNRQSSSSVVAPDVAEWWVRAQQELAEKTASTYRLALARGVARESARFILPEQTATRLYMAGTIRSWIHYLEERCSEHTQKEHRDIALSIRQLLIPHLPATANALGWTPYANE